MAFFSRFFSSPERAKLLSLEEVLGARGIPLDVPGIEILKDEFNHLLAGEREPWGDAVQALHQHGWPLPPLWLDAQYELAPRLVPTWQAERDGFWSKAHIDGLSVRLEACGGTVPEPWFTLWGVTWDDVLERALDQLRERSQGTVFQRLPSGIYRGVFEDGHAAARFLLPELWQDLFPGQNKFLAIPKENELLVAPQVLLPQLVEAVHQALAGDGTRIMGTIYQQIGEKFLPANLQDPHPIAQPQRELRQLDLMEAYKAQEEALPKELGEPAQLGMLRTQQGRSISYTLWQEGHPALLPETDLVGFVAANGRPLGIYFRQTLPRITELRGTVVDIWGPRRLRFEGFPTKAQLDRLECFASPEQMADLFRAPGQSRPSRPSAGPEAAGAVSRGGASPVPAHLRGLSLGVQDND
jgi:hypothetical protein